MPEENRQPEQAHPESGDRHRTPILQVGNGERGQRGQRPQHRAGADHRPRIPQGGRQLRGTFSGSGLVGDIAFTVTDKCWAYVGGVHPTEDEEGDGRVVTVIDITDPSDVRVDDFRDLNSVDRRPDLPGGKGLVIAEGVLVVQRMLASRFVPPPSLGTDRRLAELSADLAGISAPFFRASSEVMADIVGFHLNRGVLAAARRPAEPGLYAALAGARTVAVLEGVNDHENLGSIFRNAAGLGVDAVVFGAGCADPLYRRAVRVSMGHALLVSFARADRWPADLYRLRDNGFSAAGHDAGYRCAPLSEAMAGLRDERWRCWSGRRDRV